LKGFISIKQFPVNARFELNTVGCI